MSSNEFVIEDRRVPILAEKLAENREDEMFHFLFRLLEAQGIDLNDKPAISEV